MEAVQARWTRGLAATVLAWSWASAAAAQPVAETGAPPPSAEAPALAAGTHDGGDPIRPDVLITDRARDLFALGVQLLKDPDGARYEEAYHAFHAAYRESPSPRILGNIGLCAMKLERDGEAVAAYKHYLAEADGVSPEERAQIERDLGALRQGMVSAALTVEPAGTTFVDERLSVSGGAIVNRYSLLEGRFQLGLHAGRHRFTFARSGYADSVIELDARPGEPIERAVTLTKLPEEPTERPVPWYVWASGATTGAVAIAAAVTGVLALDTHKEFQDARDQRNLEDQMTLSDRGEKLNVATDVLIVAAAVGAGATVVLYLTRPESESAPTVEIGPLGVAAHGAF